jgi:hypothetical protein
MVTESFTFHREIGRAMKTRRTFPAILVRRSS